ncbi:hypothetical protein NIES2100_37760 [Calothrix sp. NIES-2100]|uniref:sulfite exporter TauE/SafE family protein n=1 Tax=Calothrix sp. NIES-2100 TaxID=1954172 RepID=UPI000B60989A|nr:hypothetical protein NIES2100_37760 [Calothrix sp. NIES-2100]
MPDQTVQSESQLHRKNGFSQHQAQGTTLALLVPPIDILAAWTYYKQGYVDIKIATLLCIGFVLGGWFGAKIGTELSNVILARIFGVLLLGSAIRVMFINPGDSNL